MDRFHLIPSELGNSGFVPRIPSHSTGNSEGETTKEGTPDNVGVATMQKLHQMQETFSTISSNVPRSLSITLQYSPKFGQVYVASC